MSHAGKPGRPLTGMSGTLRDPGPATVSAAGRRRLMGLAYRMLGSVDDAEDVVQDAQLRLLGLERAPDDPDAYLFRVVSNLAVDRLRHLKVQRRSYLGPWLPEPVVTEPAAGAIALVEDLGIGLLLLLERLTPAERIAFVLREAFDLGFDEMADVLAVRADACRQRYHRARRKLAGERRPVAAPAAEQRHLLEQLVDAVTSGNTERVAALLTDDALLVSDGGGKVSAAVRPVASPARIAQVVVHLASREPLERFSMDYRPLNGGVGLVIGVDGPPRPGVPAYATFQLEVSRGRISRLYVMRNPDKLTRLAAARHPGGSGREL